MVTTGDEVAVRFNDVTKRFGKTVALHEVSLAVRRGSNAGWRPCG